MELVLVALLPSSLLPSSNTSQGSAICQAKVTKLAASEAKATQLAQNMRRKLGARVRDAEAAAAAAKTQLQEAVAAMDALKV